MPLERRQLVLGAVTVVVLGLAFWTLRPATPVPATTAPTQARTRGARPGPAATGSAPVGPVKLAALAASRNDPGEAARNPFRFQPKVVPPPPRPPTAVGSEAPVVRPTPTGPAPPPPRAPIGLKLIGVLERANGVKWAVLSDGKSGPMFGKDGDIIDGRYLIVKVGAESIEMTHADGQGRQVIRLTGQ